MADEAGGAAFLPQIRAFLVCDGVNVSEAEDGVYDLEGVRKRVVAGGFPHWHTLSVFLHLFYARGGTFRGFVRLLHEESEDVLSEIEFRPTFRPGPDDRLQPVHLGPCVFNVPGWYTFEVTFFDSRGLQISRLERRIEVIEGV